MLNRVCIDFTAKNEISKNIKINYNYLYFPIV